MAKATKKKIRARARRGREAMHAERRKHSKARTLVGQDFQTDEADRWCPALASVPARIGCWGMSASQPSSRAHAFRGWALRCRRALRLAQGVPIILGGPVSTYVGVYMTTHAIATLHLPPSTGHAAPVVGGHKRLCSPRRLYERHLRPAGFAIG